MNNFDIAIAGNGMVGVITAFMLSKKFPKKKICLLGNKQFKNSASMAAGAMHAVFCEIEHNFFKSSIEQSNFEIGLKSRSLWLEILNKFKLSDSITSKNTYFYLKDKSSDFEKKNFDTACEIASKFNVITKVDKNKINKIFNGSFSSKKFKCYKIKNEFSFNPNYLITKLVNLSKKNLVQVIYEDVKNVDIKKKKYLINRKYSTDKLIITGGYNSHNIAKKLFNPVPVIKGVGTALILKNDYFKNISSVIRTSNRGGAQCGLHLVPYNLKKGEVYVGAGNYISSAEEPWARTVTIQWLLELLEKEIVPQKVIYQSSIQTLLGYRPRSIDNNPSIGAVNDTLFYVSGTNRVGLTWASYIADEILKWSSSKENDILLDDYKPNRRLKTWGHLEDACNYFASSRLSNLIEHNLIKNKNSILKKKHIELYDIAKRKNQIFNKRFNLKKDFVIDPDCYKYFEKKK